MRILNLEGGTLVPFFKDLGHQVLHVGRHERGGAYDVVLDNPLYYRDLITLLAARGFAPDLVFWCDSGYTPRIFGFEALPAVTIGYSIDTYCNPWHVPYASVFDAMFVAQKDAAAWVARDKAHGLAAWLPLFGNPRKDIDQGLARDVPVAFVGTLHHAQNRDRMLFIQAFKRRFPLVAFQGSYPPMFNRSRIVLNQSAAGELNFRLFEAPACGAAVLNEATDNGLLDLFTPGVDILPPYRRGDAAHAAAIAARAMAAPQDLERIRRAGHEAVTRRHTAAVRAARICKTAETLLAQGAAQTRAARLPHIHAAWAKTFAFILAERESRLPHNYRQLYLRLAAGYKDIWDSVSPRAA